MQTVHQGQTGHSATLGTLSAQVTLQLLKKLFQCYLCENGLSGSLLYITVRVKHWPGITCNNKNRFTVELNVLLRIILYVFDRLMFSDGFLV